MYHNCGKDISYKSVVMIVLSACRMQIQFHMYFLLSIGGTTSVESVVHIRTQTHTDCETKISQPDWSVHTWQTWCHTTDTKTIQRAKKTKK